MSNRDGGCFAPLRRAPGGARSGALHSPGLSLTRSGTHQVCHSPGLSSKRTVIPAEAGIQPEISPKSINFTLRQIFHRSSRTALGSTYPCLNWSRPNEENIMPAFLPSPLGRGAGGEGVIARSERICSFVLTLSPLFRPLHPQRLHLPVQINPVQPQHLRRLAHVSAAVFEGFADVLLFKPRHCFA